MNTGTVVVVLLIVLWGALEYERRERNQKLVLSSLKQGLPPSPQSLGSPLWKLIGLGLTAILMAAATAVMVYGGLRGVSPGPVIYGMGALFAAMAVIVALMLARDARWFNGSSPASTVEEP